MRGRAALVRSRVVAVARRPGARERGVLELTNLAREDHGLAMLAWDDRLAAAARRHAWDMSRRGYFSHHDPEGRGPADRLRPHLRRLEFLGVGENLAAGQLTAREAVDGWLASPGHRANLLAGSFDRLGVAVLDDASRGIIWAQVFGRAGTLGRLLLG